MNAKHQKYIEYIVSDIELPYLKSLEVYGLKKDEMDLVLSKLFNEPVIYIKPMHGVYNKNKKRIYHEDSSGYWEKREYEYDNNSNKIYYEESSGYWCKREYDTNGNEIYWENSNGVIEDNR